MRKPWEEAGSHRESFGGERRRDRRDGFGEQRREGGRFERRENRFGSDRSDRFERSERSDRFERSDRRDGGRFGAPRRDGDRRGAAGGFKRRERFNQDEGMFGVRSGPRARMAMSNRRGGKRAMDTNPTRNALVALDADVARVFGTSEAVNEALRKVIALAQVLGPVRGAEPVKEEGAEEAAAEEAVVAEAAQEEVVADVVETTDDEDEEWFDIAAEEEQK